ncbi:MAG: neutral zinc metallopeptidase [Myxococcota bacterium]
MRWRKGERSRNLEDRRAQTGRGRGRSPFGRGGSPVRLPLPTGRGGKMSIWSLLLMLGVMWFLGINPLSLLTGGGLGGGLGGGTQVGVDPFGGGADVAAGAPFRASPQEEELVDFVSFTLDDLQSTWVRLLPGYRDARLVLFRGATRSACGTGQREMGPFYCPGDQKVYIDLSFYQDLRTRFGAPGDFAQAYVLAHEIGHHIQKLTGIEERVRSQQRASRSEANRLSVAMELQADCLAGVWGHDAAKRGILEPGDVEEGLRAAAAIGDDRIQEMSGGGVHPESFTHGSSAQRTEWLRRGLERGDPNACDTFGRR